MAAILSAWTDERRLKAAEAPGRREGSLAGTHIDDLAATGKAVWLCWSGCQQKFNAESYGYVQKPGLPTVRGHCDGCGQFSVQMRMFVPRALARNL